jgi:ABC-type glycerol-3-phosphate transport system substrate-binding protein
MRSVRKSAGGAVASAVVLLLVASCSKATSTTPSVTPGTTPPVTSGSPSPSTSAVAAPVSITVGPLRPGATPDAKAGLAALVKAFNAKYPNITVKTVEYNWVATTFQAQLAGGTLPTVFTIPFTDGKTLIDKQQVADVNAQVLALPYASKFNAAIMENVKGANGDYYGLPIAAYADAISYNRDLFKQAGLNPDQPPKTWDEVRADAKKIHDVTGATGFIQMNNQGTGGWQLTADTYSRGGRIENTTGGKTTATIAGNTQLKASLQWLHDVKFTDNSMGANTLYGWADANNAFTAGKVGMFTQGSDVYTWMVQNAKLDPKIYGLATIPLDSASPDAGALQGGTLAVVSTKATPEQQDAAVKWIDFYYLSKLIDQTAAIDSAKIDIANKNPVGVPSLPLFNQAAYDQNQLWIKDLINVPLAQFKPFNDAIFSQKLVVEPEVATQAVYAVLDPVVQAVLTDKNANIDNLLATAQTAAQKAIDTPAK